VILFGNLCVSHNRFFLLDAEAEEDLKCSL